MTLGPDHPHSSSPAPSPADPETETKAAVTPPDGPDGAASSLAPAPAKGRNWLGIAFVAFCLLLLGGVMTSIVLPRLVDRFPRLTAVFPAGGNSGMIDELSAELAAQDNILTALKRRVEAQTSRTAALSDETAAQSASLAELTSRLNNLDEGGNGGGGGKGSGNLAARVEMLTLRIGQLESAFVPLSQRASQAIESARSQKEILDGQAELSNSITALEDRMGSIERSAAGDRRGTLIALSFAALREMANRGRPFAAEFEALSGLLNESNLPELASELQALAPYAPSGAPSLGSLRSSYGEAASAILHAAALPENASWWQRALAELKTIVIVRPTGEAAGNDTGAITARAERRLAQNDLEGAVREIRTLPKPAAAGAEAWLRGAESRLAVDETLAHFASGLLHTTAYGGGPESDPKTGAPAPSSGSLSPDSGA